MEMGRLGEAVAWLEKGVDCESGLMGEDGREVRTLLQEVRKKAEMQFSAS